MKQETEQLLVIVVAVAIGCILGIVLNRFFEPGFIIIAIVGFFAGLFLSVILHELGHLLFGRLSGCQFSSFRVMKWLWVKGDGGKIRMKKSAGIKGIGGQCMMEPPADEKDFRFVLYNAGGALVNIITCAALLIPAFLIDDNVVTPILAGIGVSSLTIGIVNIIPLSLSGFPNDGRNIVEAKKSADAEHGMYALLKTNSEMSKGKRLSDYDEAAFSVSENADINNHFVAMLIMMRSSQLEEKGEFRQSYRELKRLEHSDLSPIYKNQLIMSLIFHELVYFEDDPSYNSARERMESKANDKMFKNLLKMKYPNFILVQAAIKAFLDKDTDKARELIAQARELTPSLQNPGMEYSIMLALDRLEARLN